MSAPTHLTAPDRKYLTAPDQTLTGWPKGIPYIIGNEACERFSFYGMKSVLAQYLASLYVAAGAAPLVAQNQGSHDVHIFNAGLYAFPMIGALIAERFLGKYLTIMAFSLVYCAGHAVLAFAEGNLSLFYVGLGLIALGSGAIKSSIGANVGDQFGEGNWHLTKKVFQFFYMSVNFGSFFATLLIPILLKEYGPSVAFGLPGVLMFIATIIFYWGRFKFVRIPPKPGGKIGLLDAISSSLLFIGGLASWLFADQLGLDATGVVITMVLGLGLGLALFFYRQRLAPDDGFLTVLLARFTRGQAATRAKYGEEAYDGVNAVFRVLSVIIFVSLFWMVFDQHSSTWLTQAKAMDRTLDLPLLGQVEILTSQTASANPALVLILIPLFTGVLFPFLERRGLKLTPLKRMSVGMLFAIASFVAIAIPQQWVEAAPEGTVSVLWQLPAYILMTTGEVLISATGLEFCYSQAPRRMKAVIMACWYLMVTLGNFVAAFTIENMADRPLSEFFWICTAGVAVCGVLFIIRAAFYQYRDYAQK